MHEKNTMSKERRFELLSDRKVMNEGLGTSELWTPEQVKRLVQLEREDARLAARSSARLTPTIARSSKG